jgi:PAS domain S-box-containing protein
MDTQNLQTPEELTQEAEYQRKLWEEKSLSTFDDTLRVNYAKSLQEFCDILLEELAMFTNAFSGVLYLYNREAQKAEAYATYACALAKLPQQVYALGEGVVGQAIASEKHLFFDGIPAKNVTLSHTTGQLQAVCIQVMPLIFGGKTYGAVELVYIHQLEKKYRQVLPKMAANMSAVLESLINNDLNKKLLEESQAKAEELLAQEEEMRQNLEELQATQEALQEQKQALADQQALLAVAEKMAQMAGFEINITTQELFHSPNLATLYGYPEGTELQLDDINNIIHPEDNSLLYDLIPQAITDAQDQVYKYQFRLKHPTFTDWRHFQASIRINKNSHDHVMVIGMAQDITERVQRDIEMQEAYQRVQASEEELRQNLEELQATQEAMAKKQIELEKYKDRLEANEQILTKALEKSKANAEALKASVEAQQAAEEELRQNLEELQATQEAMRAKQEELERYKDRLEANEQILTKALEKSKINEKALKTSVEAQHAAEEELRQNLEELQATQETMRLRQDELEKYKTRLEANEQILVKALEKSKAQKNLFEAKAKDLETSEAVLQAYIEESKIKQYEQDLGRAKLYFRCKYLELTNQYQALQLKSS